MSEKLEPLPQSGSWRFLALERSGDVHAAQGDREKALASYKEAIQIEGLSQGYIDRVEEKVSKISEE